MKRAIVIAIDAALCAFLATGCATQKAPQPQIKPVLEVRHSGLQPDGYYQLGRFLQEQQRYDEAAVAYRKALALDPKHADAHNGLGTILRPEGRLRGGARRVRGRARAGARESCGAEQHRLHVPARAQAGGGDRPAHAGHRTRAGEPSLQLEPRDRIE